MLQPGHCVLKCQGKDLTRRGAKAKGARLMVVLPAQLAVKQSTEGTLGVIEKANTECPELVVKTSKGEVRYPGRFVLTSTAYFSLNLQPRKESTVCEDVFDRVLVFGEAIIPTAISMATSGDAVPDNSWFQSLGCSSSANPLQSTSSYGIEGEENEEEDDDDDLDDDDDDDDDDEFVERRALPSRTSRVRKSLAEDDDEIETDDDYGDDRSSGSDDFPAVRKSSKRKGSTGGSKKTSASTPKVKKSSSSAKAITKRKANSLGKKKQAESSDDDDESGSDFGSPSRGSSATAARKSVSSRPRKSVSYTEKDEEESEESSEEEEFDDADDSSFEERPKAKKSKK